MVQDFPVSRTYTQLKCNGGLVPGGCGRLAVGSLSIRSNHTAGSLPVLLNERDFGCVLDLNIYITYIFNGIGFSLLAVYHFKN